ncbi:hypothetical protein DL765_005644 [Monosporascus sp. GIB2]|nr:hypothetical protein DL765_005644 [Monosporascus sp. GIB2]
MRFNLVSAINVLAAGAAATPSSSSRKQKRTGGCVGEGRGDGAFCTVLCLEDGTRETYCPVACLDPRLC